MKYLKPLMVIALLAWIGGCQSLSQSAEGENAPLYQALGERSGIATIVTDLMYRIVDDKRIAFQFKGLDVTRFHRNLTDLLCALANGPCTYTGKGMREVHSAMNITATQFNALVEDLILAMEANQVPTAAQNKLLAKLAPMYDDVRNQ